MNKRKVCQEKTLSTNPTTIIPISGAEKHIIPVTAVLP